MSMPEAVGVPVSGRKLAGNPVPMLQPDGTIKKVVFPVGALQQYLNDVVRLQLADRPVVSASNGAIVRAPRYGAYSVMAQDVSLLVYDAPELLAMCSTAFTDFKRVWFSSPFLAELMRLDAKGDGEVDATAFVALHEIGHMLLLHNHRLREEGQRQSDIDTKAVEIENNSKLRAMFQEVKPGEWLEDFSNLGMKDWERWHRMSAEEIRDVLLSEQAQAQAQAPQQNQNGGQQGSPSQQPGKGSNPGQGASPGQGSPSQQPGSGNDPGQGASPGQGSPSQQPDSGNNPGQGGAGKSGDPQSAGTGPAVGGNLVKDWADGKEGAPGHNDQITEADLADILKEGGFEGALKALGLDKPGDDRDTAEAKARGRAQKAIKEAKEIAEDAAAKGAKLPGGHLHSYLSQSIQVLYEPAINWILPIRKAVLGGGMSTRYSDTAPSRLYHVDPVLMGRSDPLYIGKQRSYVNRNKVLSLIDTSGSVTQACCSRFFGVLFGLASKRRGGEASVEVYQADTILRADPIRITSRNWRQTMAAVKRHGFGGTELGESLGELLQREKKAHRSLDHIDAVIYLTDLGDLPVKREDLPSGRLPPIFFVTEPGDYRREWANAVSGFARVLKIEAQTVNLRTANPIASSGAAGPSGP